MKRYPALIMTIAFTLAAQSAYCQTEYADPEKEDMEYKEILALEKQEDQRIMQEGKRDEEERNSIEERQSTDLMYVKEKDRTGEMEKERGSIEADMLAEGTNTGGEWNGGGWHGGRGNKR